MWSFLKHWSVCCCCCFTYCEIIIIYGRVILVIFVVNWAQYSNLICSFCVNKFIKIFNCVMLLLFYCCFNGSLFSTLIYSKMKVIRVSNMEYDIFKSNKSWWGAYYRFFFILSNGNTDNNNKTVIKVFSPKQLC